MSNKCNKLSDSTQSRNNVVALSKGSRSSGKLSKGICNSAKLNSKSMKSKLTRSKLFNSELNTIEEFGNQHTIYMEKLVCLILWFR